MSEAKEKKIGNRWIFILAFLSIALHLAFFSTLEYHRDSLLYFTLGQYPDFGYNSVPPLIGWLAWILQKIVGFSLLSVRIVPALFSGLMVWLVSAITRELGGRNYAIILAAVGVIIAPVSLRVFGLYQPVFLEYTFWTFIFYLLIRFINTEDQKYLIYIGIVAGFALLNKYLVALLLFGMIVLLPFYRHRKVFSQRNFYLALLLAVIIFLPNLLWQISHDFPVFRHLDELNQRQLAHVNRIDFLIDQFMMPYIISFLTIPGLLFILISNKMKSYRIVGNLALLVVIVLCVLKGKSYYTMGVFPVLMASGAVFYESIVRTRWYRFVIPVLLVALSVPILPMGIPLYGVDGLVRYFKGLEENYGLTIGRRFEDGTIHSLPQDYADMIGWEELTKIVDEAYQRLPDKDRCIIFGSNYGQAGAICVIGKQYDLPNAISFSDNFFYWAPRYFDPEPNSLIYINDELGSDVEGLFESIVQVGSISNVHAREYGTTVYLCQNPRRSINEFWSEVLQLIEN